MLETMGLPMPQRARRERIRRVLAAATTGEASAGQAASVSVDVEDGPIADPVREAMAADRVVVAPIDGGHRVNVYKGADASLKFDLYDDWVHCVNIASPGSGWLIAANRLVVDVLVPQFGVRAIWIEPRSPAAVATLTKYAPYESAGDGWYRWDCYRLREVLS